jgi:hypothetical protein
MVNEIQRANIIIIITIFIINPFFGLVSTLYVLRNVRSDGRGYIFLFFVLLSVWLGLFNTTKVPVSDQINYLDWFNDVPTNGFWGTLSCLGGTDGDIKEPLYGLMTWAGYYLFLGNEKLFFMAITVFEYFFLFYACYIIHSKAGFGKLTILSGVISIAFFTQYFSLTLQVMRQVLATSIVLYGIALKTVDGKNHWGPILCAPLIHTTAGLFSLLSLIPFIFKRMDKKKWLVVLSILFIIMSFNIFASSKITSALGGGAASYAIERVANSDDGIYSGLSPIFYIVLLPLIFISIRVLYLNRKRIESPLYPICYMFIFLFLLIESFYKSSLVQYRFAFMAYSFMPFILPLLFYRKSIKKEVYNISSSVFFFLYFVLTFDKGDWIYNMSNIDIFIKPVFSYFI